MIRRKEPQILLKGEGDFFVNAPKLRYIVTDLCPAPVSLYPPCLHLLRLMAVGPSDLEERGTRKSMNVCYFVHKA